MYGENVLPDSKLNLEGRNICKDLEELLRQPVYYFIYYIDWDLDEESEPLIGLPIKTPDICPQCGKRWIKDAPIL